MASPVSLIQQTAAVQDAAFEPAAAPKGTGFGQVVDSAIRSVEASRQEADKAVAAFLDGTGGELHSTILATQRAELQFQLFLQCRNKLVQAYQEVMRVQV
jgi:flagellar hook-basal body complex protein FliE